MFIEGRGWSASIWKHEWKIHCRSEKNILLVIVDSKNSAKAREKLVRWQHDPVEDTSCDDMFNCWQCSTVWVCVCVRWKKFLNNAVIFLSASWYMDVINLSYIIYGSYQPIASLLCTQRKEHTHCMSGLSSGWPSAFGFIQLIFSPLTSAIRLWRCQF